MAGAASVGGNQRNAVRTLAMWASAVAAAAAAAAEITWLADLATRPSCAPGYGRLIDVELALPVLSGVLLFAAGFTVVSVWRRHRSGCGLAGLAVGLGAIAVLSLALGVASVIAHRTGPDTWGCWTF